MLTWGILLYHVTLIYTPYLSYYVRIIPEEVPSWHLASLWFIISMNAWNMPMFFFLSGIRLTPLIKIQDWYWILYWILDTIFSVFFALKKRTENQFRKERVDRLLIPALFLSLTASFPLRSVSYVLCWLWQWFWHRLWTNFHIWNPFQHKLVLQIKPSMREILLRKRDRVE